MGGLFARLRAFGRRHRALITVAGSLATAAALVLVLAGRRHEFETALWSAAPWLLALTALLQIVALVARSEAWHLTIEAAGGTVDRRVLYSTGLASEDEDLLFIPRQGRRPAWSSCPVARAAAAATRLRRGPPPPTAPHPRPPAGGGGSA